MKTLPLLLLLVFILHINTTTVDVAVYLQCPLAYWCFNIKLIEVDEVFDDTLAYQGFQCVYNQQYYSTYLRGFDDDDGIADDKRFEFAVKVEHNCNYRGEYRTIQRDMGSVSIYQPYVRLDFYSGNMFEAGN